MSSFVQWNNIGISFKDCWNPRRLFRGWAQNKCSTHGIIPPPNRGLQCHVHSLSRAWPRSWEAGRGPPSLNVWPDHPELLLSPLLWVGRQQTSQADRVLTHNPSLFSRWHIPDPRPAAFCPVFLTSLHPPSLEFKAVHILSFCLIIDFRKHPCRHANENASWALTLWHRVLQRSHYIKSLMEGVTEQKVRHDWVTEKQQ